MMKWIGGATAAVMLAFGGVVLASQIIGSGQSSKKSAEADAGLAISVDPATAGTGASLEEIVPGSPASNTDGSQIANLASTQKSASPSASGADSTFVIKRILPIDGPIKYGEWHWDDEGVPDGPLVMTVDLDARVLSVFKGGYEIGATAVLLGTDEHPTPLGVFPIMSKERHNVSEKYGNAPMPWTLRLTRDGVAIHGGADVENGYASHGCIGTPNDFISKLFAIASKGDKVIITRGQTMSMGDKII
ncbi:MAG: L,D-transpeptidase family protein [Sphingomonadaceae bacterium]